MEEAFLKARNPGDIDDIESRQVAHFRGLTLEDPDEVWMDETETGERHFTFIGHFRRGEERLSQVVICLTIDGVPSFIFLSFCTRDEDLIEEYRRGKDMLAANDDSQQAQGQPPEPELVPDTVSTVPEPEPGVAEAEGGYASEFERMYAEMRQPGDIPREQFVHFEDYVEPTIEDPDEIWKFVDDEGNEWLTFIARHSCSPAEIDDDDELESVDEFMMIAVCAPEIEGSSRTLEAVFAFPTIDAGLVQHFRKGINSLNKAFGVGWTRGRAA